MSAVKRTFRGSEGFSLVEVLIALGALLFGFIAMWGLHMSSLKVDARNNAELKAMYQAERKLEQLRATSVTNFADATLTSDSDTVDTIFQRTWTVTPVSAWRKDVTVTVAWTEQVSTRGGRVAVPRTVQLTTILTNLTGN